MYQFPCPHCSTPLRLRDTEFRDRLIHCPDCHQPLKIVQDADRLQGVPVAEPAAPLPERVSPGGRQNGPRVAAFVAAGVLSLGVMAYVLLAPDPETATPEVAPKGKGNDVPAVAIEEDVPDDAAPRVAAADLRERMLGIHQLLQQHLANAGQYPANRTGDAGRSWIAPLAEEVLPPQPVDWSRGWAAPGNDDFVRRPFPQFLNPKIPRQAGEDQYPATHFVGIAGVGPDAAGLSANHPRAGIFRTASPTHREDIRDGLAHTWLVAGAQSQLGSWARPGEATVRALTQEPYVNGPDGLGTGEPDSMLVLFADGQVREISAETDPVVLRRMAAMADGIPLDPAIAGDPLTLTPAAAAPPPVQKPEPRNVPITVPLTADVPRFDFEKTLSQQLLAYELPQAAPLAHVLEDLEDLIGVPFDASALAPDVLQQPISLSLEKTTVRALLTAVLDSVEVTYELRGDHIALLPR